MGHKIQFRNKISKWSIAPFLSCRLSSIEDIWHAITLMPCEEWVYRGQYSKVWPLATSLERSYGANKITRESERNAIFDFMNKTRLYLNNGYSRIDALAAMQHYGAPTRLLDFTRSFFVALYFAFETVGKTQHGKRTNAGKRANDHAVWAVNLKNALFNSRPLEEGINDNACSMVAGVRSQNLIEEELFRSAEQYIRDGMIINNAIRGEQCRKQAERLLLGASEAHQLGILPIDIIKSNPRMAAQNGLFIMTTDFRSFHDSLASAFGLQHFHPVNVKLSDIEKCFNIDDSLSVIKFIINDELRYEVDKLLKAANIGTQTLFPDLSGIASQIKYDIVN